MGDSCKNIGRIAAPFFAASSTTSNLDPGRHVRALCENDAISAWNSPYTSLSYCHSKIGIPNGIFPTPTGNITISVMMINLIPRKNEGQLTWKVKPRTLWPDLFSTSLEPSKLISWAIERPTNGCSQILCIVRIETQWDDPLWRRMSLICL